MANITLRFLPWETGWTVGPVTERGIPRRDQMGGEVASRRLALEVYVCETSVSGRQLDTSVLNVKV